MKLLLALLLLASTAHATRYVGTTDNGSSVAPSVIKGRWIGQDFRGRYRCKGTTPPCFKKRARVTLRAAPMPGLSGPPNGDVLGTIAFGVGARRVECSIGGLLDTTEPTWLDPREAPVLLGCISCDDVDCQLQFNGVRQ